MREAVRHNMERHNIDSNNGACCWPTLPSAWHKAL